MSTALAELLRHPGLWRATDTGAGNRAWRTLPSGHAELDAWLPGGGWPAGALTELLCEHHGIGELGLLMPLLASLTGAGRPVLMVAPPLLPYAPALAARGVNLRVLLVVEPSSPREGLWAAEQALRSGACGAVLLWNRGADGADAKLMARANRRLQLAAERGGGCCFVFRDGHARHGGGADTPAGSASPAVLRLQLSPGGAAVRSAAARRACAEPRMALRVLKCRGRAPGAPLALAGC